jgi:tripartite-type tricarboxylate transporter receptor subunit TctC
MRTLLLAAVLVIASAVIHAQTPFPSRTITIVNPNAPGGTGDIIGHGMTESLRTAFKQPVILTNRAGAGGAVGGAFVAQAPADGYTVLLNTVTHVLIPITDNMLGKSSGYTTDDFHLVARISADPLLLVVNPAIPAKNLKEFVALAKAKPDSLIYSSTGVYGSGHIAMMMLARSAGVTMVHSPFNGAGPAMTALLGNHANAFFAPAGVASPQVQAGKVRVFAQSGATRSPLFPDLPTVKESGYDADLTLWSGYFLPVKTPQPVVNVWQRALRESAQDSRFRDAMAKVNVTIDYLDGDALKAWYDAELKRLDREIRAIGKIESRT